MEKICLQCKQNFIVDEAFLSKLGFPAPSLCPDCRNQRRMMFRNDRTFYSRSCDLSGDRFISIYPAQSPYTVYKPNRWYGDQWNPMDYGREFDFNKPFFQQFKELMLVVPRLGVDIVNCENSDYCNYCGDDKDCYLDIAGEDNRDCYFNLFVKHSENVVDCTFVYNSQLCYECINCYDCYQCQYGVYLENCSDCLYCFDLKGCRDCLFSYGLRNKQYCIFNEQKTKEEYQAYVRSLKLESFSQREKLFAGFEDFKLKKVIFRDNYFLNCENCSGNNIKNSKNTFYSFNVSGCEDCKYLYDVLDAKDCQDLNYSLYKPELSYELISTLNMVNCAFSMASHYNNEIYYCDLVNSSKKLFGCIALNQKQYCILNKQYSREEYEQLVPKIIEHMKKFGEWGEFFPAELSPFAYNETVAQEYFPLNREMVIANGWRWKEDQDKDFSGELDYKIPDDIGDVDQEICGKILRCEESGRAYKIIVQELNFYKKMGLPVPRKAPDQRHRDRLDRRNPRKLFDSQCNNCKGNIKTTFSPEREEKVYCEQCYFKEIY